MEKHTYSIIIPAYNEAQSLEELTAQINNALQQSKLTAEIIYINDGSRASTRDILDPLASKHQNITASHFSHNCGKAAALHAGIARARGERIITLDADLQDDPQEIKNLIAKMDEGFDLVTGWKKFRKDPLSKTLPSKIFNHFTNLIAGTKLHDHNCGIKIISKSCALQLPLYGDLHRYIPAIAAISGYKVSEIPVNHRQRKYGRSKYGIMRIFHGFFDIITVYIITRYASKPMHFFGYIGLFIFGFGFLLASYLTYEKFIYAKDIGDRPLLNLATLCMIIGVQIGITGILGELINFNQRNPSKYYTIHSITHADTHPSLQ